MTDDHVRPPGPRFFYGWTIVGTVFVILMVTSGLGFYNASVILNAATEELGVSVAAVSGATALFFGISGLTGFVLSRKMDTGDLRTFYLAGGVLGAGALLSLRWVDSVGSFYLFFAVFGVGFALSGLVPSTTLVTRWFNRRRSIALSIASTGLSLGGIAVTPISAWLIDRRGLGGAGPFLAAIWLVGVVPIGLLLIRSRPSDLGLEPDGVITATADLDPLTTSAHAADLDPLATSAHAADLDPLTTSAAQIDGETGGPAPAATEARPGSEPMAAAGATFAVARRTRSHALPILSPSVSR